MYHIDLYNFNRLPESYWHSTDDKHESLNYSIEGQDYYPWQDNIYNDYPKVEEGYLTISEKPGWGIEPNKDWLESSNYQYFDGK